MGWGRGLLAAEGFEALEYPNLRAGADLAPVTLPVGRARPTAASGGCV